MAAAGLVVVDRRGALGAALADRSEDEPRRAKGFVSEYDKLRLRRIAAEELAACDAGNIREALRLSELYEIEEKKALGLS